MIYKGFSDILRIRPSKSGKKISSSCVPHSRGDEPIEQAITGDIEQIRAGTRYLETPAFGKGNDYYASLCSITPSRESGVKAAGRSTEQQVQLAAEILEPASGPALVINGRAA